MSALLFVTSVSSVRVVDRCVRDVNMFIWMSMSLAWRVWACICLPYIMGKKKKITWSKILMFIIMLLVGFECVIAYRKRLRLMENSKKKSNNHHHTSSCSGRGYSSCHRSFPVSPHRYTSSQVYARPIRMCTVMYTGPLRCISDQLEGVLYITLTYTITSTANKTNSKEYSVWPNFWV